VPPTSDPKTKLVVPAYTEGQEYKNALSLQLIPPLTDNAGNAVPDKYLMVDY